MLKITDNINYNGQRFNGKWSSKKFKPEFRVRRVMTMFQKKDDMTLLQ